jgi:hypothetical protein
MTGGGRLRCHGLLGVLTLEAQLRVLADKVGPVGGQIFPSRSHGEKPVPLLALNPSGERPAFFRVLTVFRSLFHRTCL